MNAPSTAPESGAGSAVPDQGPPLLTIDGALATITLNRPAHRNRLHNEDLQALLHHFAVVQADPSIRVVVFNARTLPQRPVFCAGFHIGEFEHDSAPGGPTVQFEQVADALENLRPVTVCALGGSVYGGATDLVLACDVRIGVPGIEMRMPAAALGIHYYPNGLRRYVSRLGPDATRRAFLTARPMDATTMLRIGYLTDLVEPAELAPTVQSLVGDIAALAPLAVAGLKQSINEIARGDFDRERLLQREHACQRSDDFAEGRRAFDERRAPVFTGR